MNMEVNSFSEFELKEPAEKASNAIIDNNTKKTDNRKNKRMSGIKIFAINICLILFVIYAVVTLVNQQLQISEKSNKLKELQEQIVIQEVKNDDIKSVYKVLEQLDDSRTSPEDYKESLNYIERIAREDFDYSKQGERIFVNIAGD